MPGAVRSVLRAFYLIESKETNMKSVSNVYSVLSDRHGNALI